FAFRTDHAVGDVTVGLAGGDRKVPGKDRPGQGDDDAVPDAEVVGAAHDAAVTRLVVVVPDVDVAPVDRLAVLLFLGRHGEHFADDEGAGDVGGGVDRFLLQAHPYEVIGEGLRGGVGGHVDVVAEPGKGYVRHLALTSQREADIS